YKYIGQCLLFEEQLTTVGAAHNVNYSEAERDEWLAETRFLKAAYHFFILREYGPIPITTDLIEMDAAMSAYPGRSHYDYCVNYIVSELDAVADELTKLGLVTRTNEVETGRATAMMCKALKARVLLYAASPLFNGEYPFPNWKNAKFTTPGYGSDLISSEFDPKKWERAYQAAEEALQLALDNGYYLWDQPTITADTEVLPKDIYVPVPEGADDVSIEFKQKVATMRYAVTTNETEGNHEIIWGNLFEPTYYIPARLPKNVFTTADSKIKSGWNGIAPHLEVVESFLTTAGTIPAEDPATMGCSERDFYTKAGLTAAGREEVMRICLNREPRFYAWIAFHNGDYLTRLNNG
ncbi:MAG: RagB/SusD family nutrient uptake outer membrane protein, partial [Muribaculaceae bacterium]|nr:RagB/SusD family nutrient uptake outer membrane protein [Muribaculaceae bacterium]